MKFIDGRLVYGVGPVRPIVNMPSGVLKFRICQRDDKLTVVFLRFADRVERWELTDEADGWRLDFCSARNAQVVLHAWTV